MPAMGKEVIDLEEDYRSALTQAGNKFAGIVLVGYLRKNDCLSWSNNPQWNDEYRVWISYIRTAGRSYRRKFCSCEKKAWKKFRLLRDSNPWPLPVPLRYRCSALTNCADKLTVTCVSWSLRPATAKVASITAMVFFTLIIPSVNHQTFIAGLLNVLISVWVIK